MIALFLSAFVGIASAVNVETPAGAVRSGNIAVPELPKLEIPASSALSPAGLNAIPNLAVPEAGALNPLAEAPSLPQTAVPQAGAPGAASPAKAVKQDDLALPVLERLGEAVKPGAAFSEREFSEKFDGLGKYRAPLARQRVDLSEIDPSDTGKIKSKKQALRKLKDDQVELDEQQQMLYADPKHKVLIVLQGMDTAGKDGVVKHVMTSLNPQGVQVTSFKKPTDAEKKQHWLTRIAKALPGKGMIGIFNRSQYEDILVPSVHPEWYPELSPADIQARYRTINNFEKELAEKGWTIMKFFLYISKDEQKDRLQARIDIPEKNWKFSESDLKERAHWARYMDTYQRILARTNTPWAPWYVIPANNKWYRDYLIGKIMKKTLKRLKLKFPPPNPALEGVKIPD